MDIIVITVLFVLLVWLFKRFFTNDDTLEAQGIIHEKPLPIFGNILPLILQTEGGIDFMEKMYKKFVDEK